MYKQKHALITVLFLFCLFSKLTSQISVVPSNGCMPAGLTNGTFNYTGPGIPTNVVWNFGDGSPTSTLLPTQHSYPNVGNYTVVFTAIVGGVPVTYTTGVAVNAQPSGNFNVSVPASHCKPMSVNFVGSSTSANVVYTWAFGDLSGGSGSSTSHVYSSQGSYVPVLTVQNTLTGCFFNVSGSSIHVSNPPTLQITANPGFHTCASSFVTALDVGNSSPNSPITGGGLTYNWSYPPFGTSTQPNTGNITFSPAGNYPVTLTATDNNNCSATTTAVVSLESPTISAIVPGTVCINSQRVAPYYNDVRFAVTVNSSEPTTQWDMGDGTILNFPLPIPPFPTPTLTPNVPYTAWIHTYSTPGPKFLTITATKNQCVATTTKTIFVEAVTPSFTSTPPAFSCSPTMAVSYVNQSTSNAGSTLNYTWTVNRWNYTNPGYTSTATSPNFTVTQGSLNPYTNYSNHEYIISAQLVALSQPLNCKAEIEHIFDSIRRPTAMFEKSHGEGCVPLTVTFTNTSKTNQSIYPITSYTWNFGASPTSTFAGTGVPSSTPILITYTSPGVYYPTLSISTASGCGHTSYQHTITVSSPPTFNYTLLPSSTVCAGVPVTISLSAGPTQTVQHWNIQSDGGYFSGCVSDPNPTWEFNQPGVHDFTISAYQHSCKSTSVFPAAVTVNGPVGKMRFETNCLTNRKAVKIYYSLQDVVDATLNLGDGSPNVLLTGVPSGTVNGVINHTYSTAGNYTATLTSNNFPNLCLPNTFTATVIIRNLTPDFVFVKPVICKDSFLLLDASSSVDVLVAGGTGYAWYIDNYPPHQSSSPTYTATNSFSTVGTHTAKLVVKDINGCKASITKNFRVSSPAPNFTFNANPICLSNMPVQFINTTPQTPDSVYNYTWAFGDSVLYLPIEIPHSSLTGTTSAHSPTFAYPGIGLAQTRDFTITLKASNILGCPNYTRIILTVNNPQISIARSSRIGCAPNAAIVFSINAANTHTNYNITYGDSPPINVTSYSTNSTYVNVHTYNAPGTYTPVFTVTDFGGCSRTFTFSSPMIIQTAPVVSSFTFFNVIDKLPGPGPNFCAPFSPSVVSLTQSPYDLKYQWNLGVGGTQELLDSTAFTNYPETPATYTISLNAITRPSGCATYSQNVVNIFAPKIDFELEPDPLKNAYCLGEPISLLVTNFPGVQYYRWDFGDGVVTPSVYPVPSIPFTLKTTYANTWYPDFTNGVLTLELTGYAGGGNKICKDVKRKYVNLIRVLPDFKRNAELLALDSIHCFGKQETFKNTSSTNLTGSNLSYTWSLGDGTATNSTDVTHIYAAPGTYSVKLNVLEPVYSCTATTTKKMVIFPLPKASFSLAPFSCPGIPFVISGSGSPGVSGILTGILSPGSNTLSFDPSNSFSLSTTASVSTTYSLKVTDNNGCENSAPTASIFVQQPAPLVNWDTTVVIGQLTPLNAYAGSGFSYTWSPLVSYLNCTTCLNYNPISTTTVGITYSVAVEDGFQCSVVKNTYRINIDVKASLDVPTAFTPNGDGINDVIYPGGWGLYKLIYFKVFNRWGQQVFESNDINVGWDGVFNSVPQNMETYVYQVSAETYDPKLPVLSKSGTFKLLR